MLAELKVRFQTDESEEVCIDYRRLSGLDLPGSVILSFSAKEDVAHNHIEDGISWSRWPDGIKTMQELKEKKTSTFPVINQDLLPAYPVAYIIAKLS